MPRRWTCSVRRSASRRGDKRVFPGSRHGAMLGDKVMTQALRRARIAASSHRFRSSFKHWALKLGCRRGFVGRADRSASATASTHGHYPLDAIGLYSLNVLTN